MKNIILAFILLLCISCSSEKQEDFNNGLKIETFYSGFCTDVFLITFQEHEYLYITTNFGGSGLLHSESCKCKKNK